MLCLHGLEAKVMLCKSSHWRCSVKIGVWPPALLKKEALAQVFSCEFCEILKNNFFTENLWTIASSYGSLRRLLKGQKYDGMNQSRSKQ